MKSWLAMLSVGVLGVGLLSAQQPPAVKPPVFPGIIPANAKGDITFTGLDGPGFAVAASKDLIAVACENGSILVYKKEIFDAARKGAVKPEILKAHDGPVVSVAWNGGPVMASAGADKKLIFWKMPEGKPMQTVPLENLPRALAMSPDGKLVASAGEDVTVQLWDVASAKPGAKLKDHADWIACLAFSADNKQLASGDLLGAIKLWDIAGAKKVGDLPAKPNPPPKMPPDPIAARALAFTPDGKNLVLGDANGLIQQLNIADGKAIKTYTGHTAPVTGLVFHPTGNLLISTSKDRTVKLWNPANAQPFKNLEGHGAWVEGVTFLNDFTHAATVSADQTLRTWEFAEPVKVDPKKK